MTTIPFDKVFSFSAEQLKASYLVSLRQLTFSSSAKKEENFLESDFEAEAEVDESEIESDADKMTDILNEPTKKTKKKPSKKRREIEYDLEDPFIDDSEMKAVYRSVFDLMGGEGSAAPAGSEEAAEEIAEDVVESAAMGAAKQPSFFVYRGPLSNEILSK
jgi:hypothetical protein